LAAYSQGTLLYDKDLQRIGAKKDSEIDGEA
jgi:hypothetical protein